MKRTFLPIITVLILLLFTNSSYSLNNFKYTGIAFNGSGTILATKTVSVNIQLINSSGLQFQENHSGVTTDQFGSYTITIGSGTQVGTKTLANVSATKDLKIKSTVTFNGSSGVWVVSSILKPTMSVTGAGASSGGGSGSSSDWSLTGNSGTTAGTNFLGTTDGVATELRVENSGTINNSVILNTNGSIQHDNPSSVVGYVAGNARGFNAVDLQSYRSVATQVASGDYSTVGGGYRNKANGYAATVGGGVDNTASLNGATVGGGEDNTASFVCTTVSGGYNNTSNGDFSTVGGGHTNTASSHHSTVGGGYGNTASGDSSTVGGGAENKATGSYTTIAGGYHAKADKYGQNAYASGRFSNDGDAQTSVFVLRCETSSYNTWKEMFLDGSSQRMTLNDQDTWAFTVLLVARSDDGTRYCIFKYSGVIQRNGTNTQLYGLRRDYYYTSGLQMGIVADNTNNALRLDVRANTSNTVHWVARVEVVQVNF